MSNNQWRRFILFTLPVCTLIMAVGISQMFNGKVDVNLRVGNVRSSNTSRPQYSTQEQFNIGDYKY